MNGGYGGGQGNSMTSGSEGLTGLNIEKAMNDVNNFSDTMGAAWKALQRNYETFFGVLVSNWGSPAAVANGNELLKEANRCLAEFMREYLNAAERYRKAIIVVAQKHGITAYNDEKYGNDLNLYNDAALDTIYINSVESFKENIDGVVGMNKEVVREALSDFDNAHAAFKADLDTVPVDIALYDPDNAQKSSFRANVDKIKALVEALAYRVDKYVQTEIELEIELIAKAANEASELLSSNVEG